MAKWRYLPLLEDMTGDGFVEDIETGKIVAQTWNKFDEPFEGADENGPVLAAAPDLLNALEKLLQFHEEDEQGAIPRKLWSPDYREAVETAETAIVKAKQGR